MFFGSDEKTMLKAADTIKHGGIVAFPTETVYGLGADALNPQAVAKIFKAKGRPADNPLIIHIADVKDLEKYAYPSPLAYRLAEKFWPGPFTMILPKKDIIPDIVSAGLPSVAVRFPSNPDAQRLISLSGTAIAAPSANLSGSPSPTKAEHVMNDYGGTDKIDGVFDGGACACGLESTVITLTTPHPLLLRPGFVTPEQLKELIPDLEISEAVKSKLPEGVKAQSPGLMHRHYAPKAETEGVKGYSRHAAAYINTRAAAYAADGKKCGVMCFDGEERLFISSLVAVSYGKEAIPEDRAVRMFDVLRDLDKMGLDRIFIRIEDDGGVGLAVFNRLLRACEFNITDADALPRVYGVTGLSGAGKTTVCSYLRDKGYDHIDTDAISRLTLDMGKEELVAAFSSSILSSDGTVNRKKLAELAFASPECVKKLNKITHKYIMAQVCERLNTDLKLSRPALIDGAALIEAEADKLCDALIVVAANADIRLRRIMKRDGITSEQAELRFSRQQPFAMLSDKADFIFNNDNDTEVADEFVRLTDFLDTDKRKLIKRNEENQA